MELSVDGADAKTGLKLDERQTVKFLVFANRIHLSRNLIFDPNLSKLGSRNSSTLNWDKMCQKHEDTSLLSSPCKFIKIRQPKITFWLPVRVSDKHFTLLLKSVKDN
jgi:hypothetical protein